MATSRIVIAISLVCSTTVFAVPIDFDSFGPAAKSESFEGLALGPNVGSYRPETGILVPATSTPFIFGSGITLIHPVPNPIPAESEDEIGTAGVNDFRIGPANFGLDGGSISEASDVPFGTAFLAVDGKGDNAVVKFSFPYDVLRIGAFVTASEQVEMKVFDGDNAELEKHSLPAVDVADWPANFIGLENHGGIRTVAFRGDFLAIDGLTFVAVPEPISTYMLLIGLAGFAFRTLRVRKS